MESAVIITSLGDFSPDNKVDRRGLCLALPGATRYTWCDATPGRDCSSLITPSPLSGETRRGLTNTGQLVNSLPRPAPWESEVKTGPHNMREWTPHAD